MNGTGQPQPDRPGLNPGAFFDLDRPLRRTPVWVHAVLLLVTVASVTVIGGSWWGGYTPADSVQSWWQLLADPVFYRSGLLFSLPLITILMCHELGHYVAARRNGLDASLPYFLPLPIPFIPLGSLGVIPLPLGTIGAVIRIREPFKNRRQLLQVGAWGPIAGFAATLPFLAWGIHRSTIAETLPENGYIEFGEPLIYTIMEWLIRPGLPADASLMLDPIGMAAWFGLLFTMLNMLPFSQLDGGHVVYGLLGRVQHRIAWPMVIAFALLGYWWLGWLIWAVIATILRPKHPPVWFEGLEPPPTATIPGWVAVVIFLLCFMPRPISAVL